MYHKWQSYDVWFLRYEVWQSFLSFWAIFFLFTPQQPKKSKLKKKKKIKTPEDIIILQKCTKNHHHMLHFSWDMALGGLIVIFHLRLLFALLPPPHPPPPAAYKIKMLEDIISLHKCTKIMIICCTVPEIWQVTNVIIFYFGLLFVLLPPPPNSRKNQNLWKMKKLPGNITILQMCIKNYNQMITNLFGSCQPPTPVLKTNNHWYLKGGQAQFCLCCTYSPNVNQLWKPWSGDNTLKVIYRSMQFSHMMFNSVLKESCL